MKGASRIKYLISLKKNSPIINAVFVKDLVLNTVLVMIEKWQKSIDKGGSFGALLTDLSKAFDCLPHDLLVAKLYAYGFDLKSATSVHSHLTERKQRVKTDHIYSSWEEIFFGVPQGSILEPLLFNIFV